MPRCLLIICSILSAILHVCNSRLGCEKVVACERACTSLVSYLKKHEERCMCLPWSKNSTKSKMFVSIDSCLSQRFSPGAKDLRRRRSHHCGPPLSCQQCVSRLHPSAADHALHRTPQHSWHGCGVARRRIHPAPLPHMVNSLSNRLLTSTSDGRHATRMTETHGTRPAAHGKLVNHVAWEHSPSFQLLAVAAIVSKACTSPAAIVTRSHTLLAQSLHKYATATVYTLTHDMQE